MKWISVEDELPKADGQYIVFRPPACTFSDVAVRTFRNGKFDGIFPVTHWMPLPAAPGVEE